MSSKYRQWKESPPGSEQLQLNGMFESGMIEDHETAASVRLSRPQFQEFSERVFATHFRKTKAKYGGYQEAARGDVSNGTIPELEPTVAATSQKRTRATATTSFRLDDGIQFKNAPYVTWIYTDHTQNCDFVCVYVLMWTGSRDINFLISEDGTQLVINYIWPTIMYFPEELFSDEISSEGDAAMTIDHPQIHSLSSRLLECELTRKSLPQASVTIQLPAKVQREIGTWTKSAKKSKDSRVAFLKFKAFQKNQIIEDADTSITFD